MRGAKEALMKSAKAVSEKNLLIRRRQFIQFVSIHSLAELCRRDTRQNRDGLHNMDNIGHGNSNSYYQGTQSLKCKTPVMLSSLQCMPFSV